MIIFAADDEELALKMLVDAIVAACPDSEIHAFRKPSQLLEYAKQTACDIAFLDVDMRGMSGLEVAMRLKEIRPTTNIVFATGFSEYMSHAFNMHASGYMLKPVTCEMVQRELNNLRYPVKNEEVPRVFVQTFGNFEVFVYGKPVQFSRSKAKEIFAFLVDRQGASVTTAEIAAVIWEDKEYDRSMQKQTQNMISFMMKSLQEAGVQDVIVKGWNSLAVDRAKLTCDYYNLLNSDAKAVNAYCGEYMSNYSWAELTTGVLNRKAAIE